MVRNAYSSALNPKRIKALLITNPHNPIGSYYTPSVLRDLMRFCEDKKLHYISDEVYAMSAFGGVGDDHFTSGLALVADEETSPMDPRRLHVIYSMSKDFGCAGIRMGSNLNPFTRFSPLLIETKHQSHNTNNPQGMSSLPTKPNGT